GSTVEIFDSSNNLLASCTTDSLSGGCSASFITSELGENEIKIIASKEGCDSSEPVFLTFEVLEQRYELHDFAVFNDSAYSEEDDSFYRGENLYTKFKVYDKFTKNYVSEDIVTSASLVSYDAGGNIDLERDEEADFNDSEYFHFKTTIPLTHFFFGDSAVFAFAINFEDDSMGQVDKDITILNNPPQIEDFSDISFTKITQTETIDLTEYATDLEDPDDLTWEVLSYDSDLLNLELDDSILTISPAAYTKATTNVGLAVYDLDEDSASSTIKVILNIEEQECTPGETRRCGPSTNKGICEYGLQTCTADGYWGECIGAIYPREEIENDLDDDCDGEIDEGFYDFSEAVQFTRVEVFPISGGEIEPSSIIAVKPHLSSKSSSTFNDVKAVAYLLGTDSRSLKTNFDIRKDRDNSVLLYLEIPPYVQKGDYLIKITVSKDNLHMTKFVPIIIS
ncbi:MAG: hypothetical protein PWR30_266, partial [Candidatus Woesearchaeota archaeon]|nr:hypothetical protein [Candidatus Woesearchaeota archaeon]